MGDSGIELRVLMSIFIFIGAFIVLGGMYYSSLPQTTLAINNITRPPAMTNDTNQSIFDFVGYATGTVSSMSSASPILMYIIIIPIIVAISYIGFRLLKPFS